MTDQIANTKRIAKNTLMLYFRMFFLMILGLFTSRVVLQALGETDYGIYNVVGGVVTLFTVISGSLTAAVTRFITFETGKGASADISKVYSAAVIVQVILAIVVILIAEPVGLWFIDNKMTIEPEKIVSARLVFHFSLLTFVINLLSVPQMAMITAHEKLSAYAYIGIVEGILKLSVALLIARTDTDRLILYAVLMTAIAFVVRCAYAVFCRVRFKDCRFKFSLERGVLREMSSFAGWNFIGSASGVLRDQGTNILVNLFFGPMLNAARGVALQLNNAVLGFVNNFMTAVNPQITKSFASGEHESMFNLVRKSAKFSYYLLLLLVMPILFNTEFLMELWLKDVPAHAVSFVRLFLIFSLSEVLSNPLITMVLATGNIRNYQLVVGGLQLLNLPVSYFLLQKGMAPEVTVLVAIVISQICLMARLYMLKNMVGFSFRSYLLHVYLNVLAVTSVSLPIPSMLTTIPCDSWKSFIISAAACVLSVAASIIFMGCTKEERAKGLSMIQNKLYGKNRG